MQEVSHLAMSILVVSITSGYEVIDGQLDELSLWSTVKSASEIRENMFKMLTGNESGLIGYYTFDNTTGTTLQDFSGNENDGTLINMASEDWISSSAFNTWLNTDSNTWSSHPNWSWGRAPSSTDNLGIYAYSGGVDPSLDGSPTLNNIYLGSGALLSLTSGFTLNGNLFLDNDLDLNGQVISLGSNGQLIESPGNTLYNSNGNVTVTQTLSGITSENVGGLGAEITTAANIGSTTITRTHAAQTGNGNQSILRAYDISPTNNSGLNATLVFHYDDSELNGLDESTLILYRSEDGGSTWQPVGGTVNTTENTITLSNIDQFSLWTAGGTGDDALPVELSWFSGQNSSSGIKLNWTTQTETDNAGFILLRNGVEVAGYENTDALKGHGTTSQPQSYTYTDSDVSLDATYTYQLVSMDYSGLRHNYPQTVEVKVTEAVATRQLEEYGLAQNYPNPFNPSTTIKYTMKEAGEATLKVYDVLGRMVFEQIKASVKGENQINFNGSKLTSGMYYYQLNAEGFNKTLKMMLVK